MQDLELRKNWFQTGPSSYYQKHQYFAFDNTLCSASGHAKPVPAPNGGMIMSLWRSARVFIDLLNNSGYRICNSISTKIETVHSVFWFPDGNIGILDYSGDIHIISGFGDLIETIPFPSNERTSIIVAHYFNYGIAYITEQYEIMVFNVETRSIIKYGQLDGKVEPILIDFAPQGDRGIIYMDNKSVLCFDASGNVQKVTVLNIDPTNVVIHRSGKSFAAIGSGKVVGYQIGGAATICLKLAGDEPRDIAFLDENSLVATNGTSTVVATFNSQNVIQFNEITNVHFLFGDFDGVRIFGSDVWTLTAVPKNVIQLELPPSNATKINNLLQADQHYSDKNIASYAIIEDNIDYIEQSVKLILAAAPHILDIDIIERLLHAAAFAKYWLPKFDHNAFAQVVKRVRLLQTMRRPQEAIESNRTGFSFVTTAAEYEQADKMQFVSLCAQMRFFDLAEYISKTEEQNDLSTIATAWAQMVISSREGMLLIPNVIERLAHYPNIDYKRLALFAKANGASVQSVQDLIKQVKRPYERIKLLQGTPDDSLIADQLLELKDGSSYIRHIFYKRFTSVTDRQKLNFINTPVTLDQAVAFQRFINIKLLEDFNIPTNKQVELMMIHTIPPNDFGRVSDHLGRVSRILEKNSPFLEVFRKQEVVDDMLAPLPSGPSEINGTGPAPSPREVMKRALVKDNEKLFNKIAKEYNVDERTQNFIKIKTYTQFKHLSDKLAYFCNKVSAKMPVDRFADIAYDAGEFQAAYTLANKISKSEDKLQKLISFKMYKEAAQVAKSMKNNELAQELLAKVTN